MEIYELISRKMPPTSIITYKLLNFLLNYFLHNYLLSLNYVIIGSKELRNFEICMYSNKTTNKIISNNFKYFLCNNLF